MNKREKVKLISSIIRVLKNSKSTYYDNDFYICHTITHTLKVTSFSELDMFIKNVCHLTGSNVAWQMYELVYVNPKTHSKCYIIRSKKAKMLIMKQFRIDFKSSTEAKPIDFTKYTIDYLMELTKSVR